MERILTPLPCAIAVVAKASAPGRTKTRLVPPLVPDEAALMNTAFLRDIIANIQAASRLAPMTGYVAYGPPGSGQFFADIVPRQVECFESWLPNFGACLRYALDYLLARGHGAAAVLNSDSPTLPPAILAEMATVLAQPGDRAVLGPSSDGGYYVLGLKAAHARLFEEIDWSTERVAEQTLARAREIDLPVHILPTWYDVDDAASLRILWGELFQGVPFGEGEIERGEAHHSRSLLQKLFADSAIDQRLGVPGIAQEPLRTLPRPIFPSSHSSTS